MHIIDMPQGARAIVQGLQDANYEAYVVGGCVRDGLLGLAPADWDICTSATPEEMKEHFARRNIPTIDTGIKHGTITVDMGFSGMFEVTTFRIAIRILSGLPGVSIRICPEETLPSMQWRLIRPALLTRSTAKRI